MSDVVENFFGSLHERGHEPQLARASGTLRLDLVDGDKTKRWLVTIDKGKVAVSRKNARADSVVRADRTLFERILDGEANGMAAVLRGAMHFEGDPHLLVLFQRLFRSRGSTSQVQEEP